MRAHDEGVAQTFAFLVAGTIFVSTLAVILVQTHTLPADASEAEQASLENQSHAILERLLSQGIGEGDDTTRIGLAQDDLLDPDRIDQLRGATLEPHQNDRIDYQEARQSLDLPQDTIQFHLTIIPTKDTTYDLTELRTAYLADFPEDTYGQNPLVITTDPTYHSPGENVLLEIQGLVQTDVDFQPTMAPPTWYTPDIQPLPTINGDGFGDIYAEPTNGIDILADQLDHYDAIIIGSKAPQNTFHDHPGLPEQFRDWVLDGGILIILGSEHADIQWLQPLLDAGQHDLMGRGITPDHDHPTWKTPNALSRPLYYGGDFPYQIDDTMPEWDLFDHIITVAGPTRDTAKFAISKDGAFGNGSLALSTYFPPAGIYDPGAGTDHDNARLQANGHPGPFLENLLVHAHHKELFLEYGPDPPRSTDRVASQLRLQQIDLPDQEPATVWVELRAWQGGPNT